ncbi:MAG: tRNA pseudouridine(55) synthase TruB, partial [Bifidobacteriaceae bacterium]|nr:tRNA pseudouridine(55) synthase TruB [Bifidobacteriaceae bacterium]
MTKTSHPAPTEPRPGLIVVDKPAGWTSHDVVARVRRLAGTKKVGHAGTLDPLATGVLVVGVGRATRLLTFLVGLSKEYTATIRLGASTTTDDAAG